MFKFFDFINSLNLTTKIMLIAILCGLIYVLIEILKIYFLKWIILNDYSFFLFKKSISIKNIYACAFSFFWFFSFFNSYILFNILVYFQIISDIIYTERKIK